jgi:DNA repair exonuclease SbcCD ATPase subunit
MPEKETYDEILQDAKVEKSRLNGLIERSQAKMNQIRAASPAGLSDADLAELEQLDQDQQALAAAMRKIALVTLEKLDKTDELERLVQALNGVRTDLEARRARIDRFAQGAQQFGATLQGLAQLVTRIDKVKNDLKDLTDRTG